MSKKVTLSIYVEEQLVEAIDAERDRMAEAARVRTLPRSLAMESIIRRGLEALAEDRRKTEQGA